MASQRDDGGGGGDDGKDTRRLTKEEAAFILGAGGKTKQKLANASGAQIDVSEAKGDKGGNRLEIRGGAKERERARKYIEFVIAQRVGPVKIDSVARHDDLTILQVPADAVSFITGKGGSFLRLLEEEWGTLLFFLQVNPKCPPVHVDPNHTEKLAIFGPERGRRGAELKVMAAIEQKQHGYFTKNCVARQSQEEGFDTDTMPIGDEDYSYALGRSGNTRKKLARASCCIVEYIGKWAYFSGTKKERTRAREYLQWLLHQRVGELARVDSRGRDDVTVVLVPRSCIGFVTGARGVSLRAIEEETSTFCFIEGTADDGEEQKPLMIFGRLEDRRWAESMVYEKISQKSDEFVNDPPQGAGSRKGKGKDRGTKGHDPSKGKGAGHGSKGNMLRDYGGDDGERPVGKDISADVLSIIDTDAAFLMGPNGKTKKKIAAVSGAHLILVTNRLEIVGTKEERERAKKYVKLVMAQRVGPVRLDDVEQHDDLSVIEVPAEAVSFVTGKQGSFLRLVEEEFGTLLFFIDFDKSNRRDQLEKLAVFGPERERRGAELKVMAAIEMKQPGHFTGRDMNLPMSDPQDCFATDRMQIEEEDYSYALGKGGATRKKIARASGCIIEYIGRLAYLSGQKKERTRAREYLTWLFRQRVGPVEVDYARRDDVTVLPVPKDCVGFVTGHKGTSLRAVEDATGTFCFIEGGRDDPHRDPKPLLIFGALEPRRQAEERLRQRIEQKLEEGWVHEDGYGGGYNDGGKGDRGRHREARRPLRSGGRGGGGYAEGSGFSSAGAVAFAAHCESSTATTAAAGGAPGVWAGSTGAPLPMIPVHNEPSEPEEDGAWGDWGGASDEDEPQTVAASSASATPSAVAIGVPATVLAADSSPTPVAAAASGGGGMPPSTTMARQQRQQQPSAAQLKAEQLRSEELDLPPQLLHEEAWPELGAMAGNKKGGRKK